ncbi:hypothetical protein F5888DRAFT_115309 [Russula emetica]|nr:hypothetical protein F5888DRAFT_115309 [Russula emetica]
MPVTRATKTALAPTQTPAPQKASSTDIIRGSPKPEPPAYHAVPQQQQQQQIYPSEERSAITRTRGPGPAVVLQSQQSTVQVQLRTPPKPAAVAHRSARGEGETQSGRRPTSHHSGSPQLRSVRSAHEERSRPAASAGGTRTQARVPPLLPAAVAVQPERAHLPSYHSAQPFPNSPAPPPYRVSAEDNSYPTSVRSRSLPRSSRKHGARTFEKEATPLPPLPPLPSHHLHHPQLSSSAISRIQAGFKVSKEFGDAIMQQELRLVTPTSDHSRLDHHPVPNPRLGRRFLSASELQSHRRARLRTDKNTPEHEARQRTSNKSSSNVGRCSGDSRQRVVSALSGKRPRQSFATWQEISADTSKGQFPLIPIFSL